MEIINVIIHAANIPDNNNGNVMLKMTLILFELKMRTNWKIDASIWLYDALMYCTAYGKNKTTYITIGIHFVL